MSAGLFYRGPCSREAFGSSMGAAIAGRKAFAARGEPVKLVDVEVSWCGCCRAWHHSAGPPSGGDERADAS